MTQTQEMKMALVRQIQELTSPADIVEVKLWQERVNPDPAAPPVHLCAIIYKLSERESQP